MAIIYQCSHCSKVYMRTEISNVPIRDNQIKMSKLITSVVSHSVILLILEKLFSIV